MQVGERVLFYRSNCPELGIAGLAEICAKAYPDETRFDPGSKHDGAKAARDKPHWVNVEVKLVKKIRLLGLVELRRHKAFAGMRLLAQGDSLSITPVDPDEWKFITTKLLK